MSRRAFEALPRECILDTMESGLSAVKAANNASVRVSGVYLLSFKMDKVGETSWPVVVVDADMSWDMFVGIDFLRTHGIVMDCGGGKVMANHQRGH